MTSWYTMKRNGMKSAAIREHVGGGRRICRMDASATSQDEALVASAPDMLEALRTLSAWVEGQKLNGVLPKGWNFQYVESAIAKAEGRS